jgi:RNA polymerase sigma factor (TIGR02999 family)
MGRPRKHAVEASVAGDVTALLLEWSEGRERAREQLIPLVYQQLRRIAGRSLKAERVDHTLQPTALVHEAYQKLVDQRSVRWRDRAHFFAVAARTSTTSRTSRPTWMTF